MPGQSGVLVSDGFALLVTAARIPVPQPTRLHRSRLPQRLIPDLPTPCHSADASIPPPPPPPLRICIMARSTRRRKGSKLESTPTASPAPSPSASVLDGCGPGPSKINQIDARPHLEGAASSGVFPKAFGAFTMATIPAWAQTAVMVSLIFGGCCSNVGFSGDGPWWRRESSEAERRRVNCLDRSLRLRRL